MKKEKSFEENFRELEAIVQKIEAGEGTLEENLEALTKGVTYLNTCRSMLEVAEQKVTFLSEEALEEKTSSQDLNGEEA